MLKRIGIGVLVATVVVAGVAGVVLAQEPTPPTDDPGPYGRGFRGMRGRQPQALADALGITVEEVHGALAETVAELAESQDMSLQEIVDALIAPVIEHIQQAVEDGRLTQEQADEQIAQMEENTLQGLESGSWFSMGGNGFGGRPGGPQLELLAEALGMTVEELREAIADGQTIAELAEAQDVTLEDIVDALAAPMIERIQQAVEDGRLTQEQADAQIEQMQEHLLQMLESGSGFGREMERGGFRGRPGGMPGGRWGDGTTPPGLPSQMAPSDEL
jgi:hypothetical protein